ncbi:MAG: hypothetical protein SGI88_00925 [Candidatus Hydrogenedentes bacterium]|nr:hypothetical protein [Candidatus Hydrogenedentota bacterium]
MLPTSGLPHVKQFSVVLFVLVGAMIPAAVVHELGRILGFLPVDRVRLSALIWFATIIWIPIAVVVTSFPIALLLPESDDAVTILVRGLWAVISVVGVASWSAVMQSYRTSIGNLVPLIALPVIAVAARPIGVSLLALDTVQVFWNLVCAAGIGWSYGRRAELVGYAMDDYRYRSQASSTRKGPWKWDRNRYWRRMRYSPITFQSSMLCAVSLISPLSIPLMKLVDPFENKNLSVIVFVGLPILAFVVLCGNLSVMRPLKSMPWNGWQKVNHIVLGFACAHVCWLFSAVLTEAIFSEFPFAEVAMVIAYSFGISQVIAALAFLIQQQILRIIFVASTLSFGLFGPFIFVMDYSRSFAIALLASAIAGMLIGPWLLFHAQQRGAMLRSH